MGKFLNLRVRDYMFSRTLWCQWYPIYRNFGTLKTISVDTEEIIDTTAAGDAFSGGVLYILSQGKEVKIYVFYLHKHTREKHI